MNEPKFKIGDKVRVLDGSKIEDYAGGWASEGMDKYVGKICTIKDVRKDFQDEVQYVLNCEGIIEYSDYGFDERGLELADQEATPKFEVGDKVKIVKLGFGIKDKTLMGKKFTVKSIKEERGVGDVYKLDDPIGFSWLEWQLELVADFPKIIITTDGKTTLARLYDGKKVVKSAEAHCSPDDKFDFEIGAKIAFDRLMKTDERTKSVEFSKAVDEFGEAINAFKVKFMKIWGNKE